MSKVFGVLTGGGDCPGLNSVLYGIILKTIRAGHKVIGIEKGWKGFLENSTVSLDLKSLEDLHTIGGTILYTSRTNPYKGIDKSNPEQVAEVAKMMASKFDELGIDALIAIGGDLN